MNILGHKVTLKRRRYGNSQSGVDYSQASITIDGAKILLAGGKWWPVKTPPVADLEAAVTASLQARAVPSDPLDAQLAAIGADWTAAMKKVEAELN